MFENTEYDWQKMPKNKQKKLLHNMLDKIKKDYPDNLEEKLALLVMNRSIFEEMPEIEYKRVFRDVFGSKSENLWKLTFKLKDLSDKATITDTEGNIIISPE